LRFVKRNLSSIDKLLDQYQEFPLVAKTQKYLCVAHEAYRQQVKMWDDHSHTISDRIVSIHQPHVRLIVRGKQKSKVEFGAKIQVSLIDGFAFVDGLSWDAFNEGTYLMESINPYKKKDWILSRRRAGGSNSLHASEYK